MSNRKKKVITVLAFSFALVVLWTLYTFILSLGLGVFGLIVSLLFGLHFSLFKVLLLSGIVGAIVIGFIVLANRKVIKEEIDNCFPKE